MSVAIDASVVVAIRNALYGAGSRSHHPLWLILGDDERFRLERELREHMSLPDGSTGELKELYGVRVAFHATPSLLEVIWDAD